MEEAKKKVTVLDWGVSNATLEEVRGERAAGCVQARHAPCRASLPAALAFPVEPRTTCCLPAGVHQVCQEHRCRGRHVTSRQPTDGTTHCCNVDKRLGHC